MDLYQEWGARGMVQKNTFLALTSLSRLWTMMDRRQSFRSTIETFDSLNHPARFSFAFQIVKMVNDVSSVSRLYFPLDLYLD